MMEQTHHTFGILSIITLVLAVISFGQGLLAAQEPTSEVTGIVTDSIGAAIPHARVTFKDDSSTTTTETDENGRFRLALRSGRYVATVNVRGFKVMNFLDFRVQAPTPAELKAVLQIMQIIDDEMLPESVLVPTTTSDLPGVIREEQPSPPATQSKSAASKNRPCHHGTSADRKGCTRDKSAKLK